MRRRVGVLGLVIAALLALWWWHGSGETVAPGAASNAPLGSASLHAAQARAQNATLGGRVTRVRDGAPLAGASLAVVLAGDVRDERKPSIVMTGPDGRWAMPLAAGTYRVGVVADGFLPETRGAVLVVAHATATLDLAMREGGVAIRGVVSDIGGGPIAGARVSAEADEAIVAAFTHPDGSYRLTLDSGFQVVKYGHDDYLTVSAAITLTTQDTVHNAVLVPAGTIRGIVVASDTGKPVANAVISAPQNYGVVSTEAETGADGTFVLHSVGAGDVLLFANAPGYVTTRPTIINLGIGDSVEARLVADRGYTLRGRITREGHPTEGVSGVVVEAHTDAPVPDARTRVPTAGDGAFVIEGLAPARYTLTATGHDILSSRRTDVVIARNLDDVRIEVTSGVTLHGRIDPPDKVRLLAFSSDAYEAMHAMHITEDPSGAFTATNVPPGTIQINATSTSKSGDLTVRVGKADQSGLVLALQPVETKLVSGTVVDESNTPIAGAWIGADADSTFAGDDGAFELRASGPTDIHATLGANDHYPMRDVVMHLDVDRDIHGLVVKIPTTRGEIRGHVLGVDGKPAGDTWVSAGSSPVLTAADGSFTIPSLRKGTYDVRADTARGDATATVHDVATGTSIEIRMQAAPTLRGRVTLAGAPVPHYDLRCQGSSYYERRIDAADGTFALEHVSPSAERPLVCRAATEQAEGHATVVFAEGSAQVAIELTPFATVTGTVLDVFAKQPIRDAQVMLSGRPLGALFTNEHFVAEDGRFEIDHAPSEDLRILVRTKRAYATVPAHPIAGRTLDVGTMLMLPTPHDPADLQIYVTDKLAVRWIGSDRNPGLHVDDTIVAIDGIPTSSMPGERWTSLFMGNAERGHTYALTLARGVTVNITAE